MEKYLEEDQRDRISENIVLLRQMLEKIENASPQDVDMHTRAIWLEGQIFALENLLCTM